MYHFAVWFLKVNLCGKSKRLLNVPVFHNIPTWSISFYLIHSVDSFLPHSASAWRHQEGLLRHQWHRGNELPTVNVIAPRHSVCLRVVFDRRRTRILSSISLLRWAFAYAFSWGHCHCSVVFSCTTEKTTKSLHNKYFFYKICINFIHFPLTLLSLAATTAVIIVESFVKQLFGRSAPHYQPLHTQTHMSWVTDAEESHGSERCKWEQRQLQR